MIRVVAGLLREEDTDGRGPLDVDKWTSTVQELQQLLVENDELRVDGYRRPMLAYELSVKRMLTEEKQLLSVLRHFQPVHEVATEVVEVVWEGLWAPHTRFKAVLQKMQRMNLVDLNQREHYGFKYSVLLLSGCVH
jgi:hypothetical protein